MVGPCFRIKESNPPVCGVHNVPLVRHQSSEELAHSMLRDFAFFVCPESGMWSAIHHRRSGLQTER
jgi:hypothetical protein